MGRDAIKSILQRRPVDRRLVPVPALPLQAVATLSSRLRPDPLPSKIASESADAAEIAAALPEVSSGLELRIDWDEPELDHILGLSTGSRGG